MKDREINRNGKKFRVIGYAYFIVLILCIYMQVKFYLPAPFYTVLFAGGAVCFEAFADRHHFVWLKRIPLAAIFLMGLVSVPFVRPVLPVELLMKVSGRGVYMGVKGERQRIGRLHQHFADRFGWEEMTAIVAKVYNTLNEQERSKACILAGNYGEAGAIWLYGEKYGLPKPISGHLQYFIWGTRGNSADVVISLGIDIEKLKEQFDTVDQYEHLDCDLAMNYERYLPVYVCRGPKRSLEEILPTFKHLD